MPHSSAADASDCLTDGLLAELVDGRLAEETLAHVHRHVAECQDCYVLLVMVAQGTLNQEVT